MTAKTKQILSLLVGLLVLTGSAVAVFITARWVWRHFTNLNPEVAAGLLTAFATVLGATITIALGRVFERKKEVEAHFRERKSAIYDEFLKAFFSMYHSDD